MDWRRWLRRMGGARVNTVLVGVDTGGTRTNVEIVVERDPEIRSRYEVADSLSGALDPTQYVPCLSTILDPLRRHCRDLEVDDLPMCVFISAAAFSPWARNSLVRAIREVCPSVPAKIVVAGIANDAVALLLGLAVDGVVIAGTGSSVLLRAPTGQLHQIGGYEWVASDSGSGFWIGLRSIRRAYRDLEAEEDSVLLQRLRELYGIRPSDKPGLLAKLRDLSIAGPSMKKEVARFATSVCGAAERGDQSAQDIVKAEAEELADMLATALRSTFKLESRAAGIHVVECGGVLGNDFYRTSFESQVEMRLRSGSEHRANLKWTWVGTATDAAVNLARAIQGSTDELLAVNATFRPAIVRLS
jgi:N-acetylglucosamine kinase-like BadF-type ATPase